MSIFRKKKNLKQFKSYIKILVKLIISNPLTFYLEIFSFYKEYLILKKNIKNTGFRIFPSHPYLFDKKDNNLKLQYFHFQDLWAFEKIKKYNILQLLDIGSNLNFITFASSICKINYMDIRLHKITINNINSIEGDITKIPYKDDSITNISSLSVIEHIGLGRYGDQIDINGMEKSVKEFERVLKKGGNLIVSFPIGKENIIEFNAHRISNLKFIEKLFTNFKMLDETFIFQNNFNDRKEFIKKNEPNGIGCFHFIKI